MGNLQRTKCFFNIVVSIILYWNSSTLAISCEKLTHWKRPWCWEGLVAGGEGDNRGWDGWIASLTRWTWVWVNSGSWWWAGRPGVLRFMGSQRVGHDWATELNWTEASFYNLSDLPQVKYPQSGNSTSSLDPKPLSIYHSSNMYCTLTTCWTLY